MLLRGGSQKPTPTHCPRQGDLECFDTPPRAKMDPREQSIFDLIESERTYRDDLAVLVKQCMQPLQQQQQQLQKQKQHRRQSTAEPKKKRKLLWFMSPGGSSKAKGKGSIGKSKTPEPRRRKSCPSIPLKPVLTQPQVATIFRNVDR